MEIDEDEVANFLEHFGVKGMKWGQRKSRSGGVSRKTDREAQKDAKEFARAKLFYGKGAGTRRKLIKATVEAKSKRDPSYAKAFDKHLNNQDLSIHASKARSERSRKDKRESARQTTGAVARRVTGEMGTKAAFVALAAGGAAYMRSPKAQAAMKNGISKVRTSQQTRRAQKFARDFLKKNM